MAAPEAVADHYERLLARHYSWMLGGFAEKAKEQEGLLRRLGLHSPQDGALAIDLGCGAGAQAVPLAQFGYQVRAIDLSATLLDELSGHADGLPVETVEGDMTDVTLWGGTAPELIVCMGDTLTHLFDQAAVEGLIGSAFDRLAPGGRLVLSFRDLTRELAGTSRFLMLRGEHDRVMTCFLEFARDTVTVHDIVHERHDGEWEMSVSAYDKLRLAPDHIKAHANATGFETESWEASGLVVGVFRRPAG